MKEKEIISDAVDTTLDSPITITLDYEPRGWFERLFARKKRTYKIRPLFVGSRMRIIPIIETLPDNALEDISKTLFNAKYNNALIYIAAVCLQNDRNEPSPSLIRMLKWQTDEDIERILQFCLAQIKLTSFINSIVLIKGANILSKTSLNEQGELIAPGE